MAVDLWSLFRDLSNENSQVKVFTTYKGAPISYDASFLKATRKNIVLEATPALLLCSHMRGFTFVQNPRLPETVKGTIPNVDLKEQSINITALELVGKKIGIRFEPRAVPLSDFPVMITSSVVATARVIDLSVSGLAVMMAEEIFDDQIFGEGKKIQVDFRDPGNRSQVRKIRGTVRYTHQLPKEPWFRLGIQTNPQEQDKQALGAYVTRRQAELMAEVEALYQALYAEYQKKLREEAEV